MTFDLTRKRIASMSAEPELIAAILADSRLAPHPALVPCIIWTGGLSRGLPIMGPGGRPAHPVRHYFGMPDRISRCCGSKLCVNPFHFISLPRQSSGLQHPIVFEAEEQLDLNPVRSMQEALARLDLPAQFVIQAYKNQRQLGLRNR